MVGGIKAIILDLDGTLVDTNPHHVEAWRRSFARHGYDVPADRIGPQMGKGGDQLVPAVLPAGAAEKDGDALRKGHKEAFAEIAKGTKFRVLPGAEELIRAAKAAGLTTAVATSSGKDHLKAIAESCGVDFTKLVDVVANADDVEASKPEPDLIQAAVDKVGLPAAQCVVVGDTPYDAEASRKAGVRCWGLLTGGFSDADLRAAGAEQVWPNPAALLNDLPRLTGGT